jgi:hypothetical protein
LLETAAKVDQRFCAPWESNAALAVAKEQRLQVSALINPKPFGNQPAPYLSDPNWPRGVRARLP